MATGLYQSSNNRMESGERYTSAASNSHNNSPRSPENSSVGFHMPCPQYQEDRKKYLTAKYGSHQMKLIRKRLAVEDWLDTELRKLYGVVSISFVLISMPASLFSSSTRAFMPAIPQMDMHKRSASSVRWRDFVLLLVVRF